MTRVFAALTAVVLLATTSIAQVGRRQSVLDINTASEKDLSALPHMTADLTTAIVAQRPFSSMIEVNALLKPLTPQQRTELYRRAFLAINLNTAAREEILMIPGVGERMLHEFEEYRPYKTLGQFRKEIGKYVDDSELARLEQYVFVPVNLNTATDADILTIPGVGQRLLHEFKEYRPYKAMAQFRKEIGKYVSQKEVARLERYVTLGP